MTVTVNFTLADDRPDCPVARASPQGMPQMRLCIARRRPCAFRLMSSHRGFAAAALITVALAVGGTSAVFGVVYGVLFRPPPYRSPSGSFGCGKCIPARSEPIPGSKLSGPTYRAWAAVGRHDPGHGRVRRAGLHDRHGGPGAAREGYSRHAGVVPAPRRLAQPGPLLRRPRTRSRGRRPWWSSRTASGVIASGATPA